MKGGFLDKILVLFPLNFCILTEKENNIVLPSHNKYKYCIL